LILVAAAGVHAFKAPFLLRRHNVLEFVLICVNALLFMFGLIYAHTHFAIVALDSIVITLLALATLYIIWVFLQDLNAHIKTRRYTMQEEDETELKVDIMTTKL